jgi:hypothetical protein
MCTTVVALTGCGGTPGTYEFSIRVSVSEPMLDPDQPSPLCWNATERTYLIVVSPSPG